MKRLGMRQGPIQFSSDADLREHVRECAAQIRNALARQLAGLVSNSDRSAFLHRYEERHGAERAHALRTATWEVMRSAA